MPFSPSPFPTRNHTADLCVVGGGMAGLCAALAAARRGIQVILMHDRPVLGGNASSEVGVHIAGADRVGTLPHLRETGLLEELRLKNHADNPQASLSVWDLVLYDTAVREPKLTLLLNTSCLDATMAGKRIVAVTGWQTSTQTWQTVTAKVFADCSGDGILAPLTGAAHRMGREGLREFGESFAPAEADACTMGMSCGFFTREYDHPIPFTPPSWAQTYACCDDLPWGEGNHDFWLYSPWWVELGGEQHSIHDTEEIRAELTRVALGVWDHIKNRCVHSARAANWALERVQFVPGKRESIRYIGAHMLTQGDIAAGGPFADTVAYGGWTMDDHHPAGIASFARDGQPPTVHHPAPSPYGIPYRSLYSHNIANLFFAGRVASCTHTAMSSTRVMGTCCSMGQAVGTAAALAVRHGITPAALHLHIAELQQQLLADDAYLPGVTQQMSLCTKTASLVATHGDPEPVRDGINRQVGDNPHCWTAMVGSTIAYHFPALRTVHEVTLVLDSALERSIAFRGPGWQEPFPRELPRQFRLEIQTAGSWETIARIEQNTQRHFSARINRQAAAIRWVLEETWGARESRVYAFLVDPLHCRQAG